MIEPNTNEKAVVRILVPTKKVPASELVDDKPSPRVSPDLGESPKKGEEEKEVEKPADGGEGEAKEEEELASERKPDELVDIEEEQNDMALAVGNRVSLAPAYSLYIMNQYAQRMHR